MEFGKAYPFLALRYLSSPSRFPGQLFDALLLSSDPVAASCPSESLAQAWGRGEGSQGNCALGRRPSGHWLCWLCPSSCSNSTKQNRHLLTQHMQENFKMAFHNAKQKTNLQCMHKFVLIHFFSQNSNCISYQQLRETEHVPYKSCFINTICRTALILFSWYGNIHIAINSNSKLMLTQASHTPKYINLSFFKNTQTRTPLCSNVV